MMMMMVMIIKLNSVPTSQQPYCYSITKPGRSVDLVYKAIAACCDIYTMCGRNTKLLESYKRLVCAVTIAMSHHRQGTGSRQHIDTNATAASRTVYCFASSTVHAVHLLRSQIKRITQKLNFRQPYGAPDFPKEM